MKKIIIVFVLVFSGNLYALELVLNGITYNIDQYKISNNGQRIVINHPTIRRSVSNCSTSSRARSISSTRSKYKKVVPKIRSRRRLNPFEKLMREFDTRADDRNKLRYQ